MVLSRIGDRIGRKKTLIITGGATVPIGLPPTCDGVGSLAPVLLVVLRIVQGPGTGGEWGGAPLIAAWLLSRFDDSRVPVAGCLVLTAVVPIVAAAPAGRASKDGERHPAASERG
ncbi:hypothetical protein [Nocardiopsis sp. RV163]|uniref:hypothetical protein n=1 Tax=Nocardiopsis sp. RV163 TaxID=1661388 RepID=UPI00069E3537